MVCYAVRYCPSIEDKIVRFADKESHQIFLEPEGRNTPELYVQVRLQGLCSQGTTLHLEITNSHSHWHATCAAQDGGGRRVLS